MFFLAFDGMKSDLQDIVYHAVVSVFDPFQKNELGKENMDINLG